MGQADLERHILKTINALNDNFKEKYHLSDDDFETGEIIRSDWSDALVFVPGRGEETVFRHCPEDGYYYDLLDGNTRCQYIDDNTTSVKHGCCNLRNMSYESVCGSVKVYRKERR